LNNKKILIHSLVFSPDAVSTAYIYNDIAIGLKENNFDVVVITTTPHYNKILNEIEKQNLRKCWWGLFYKSYFKEITVYHIPQKKFTSFFARAASFIYWHFLSFILGVSQKNISLILSPSPPLTIGIISILIGKIKNAKVVYNVQEIYPDFLINQGSLKSGIVIKILKRLERIVYNYSDSVTTIDEVFYNAIVPRFIDPTKLCIIPNFVDTDIYRPVENPEKYLNKEMFPLTKVLKVMYAGNIGHAQDWDPLLKIAKTLRTCPVEFWVIGEGVSKQTLQYEIDKNSLKNIHLLPYQAREQMRYVISYADIHFIFMNQLMEGQGFPSKVYSIMACKKPLLVISGKNSPLNNFLKDEDAAYLISSTDLNDKCKQLEAKIRAIIDNKQVLFLKGEIGYKRIVNEYSKRFVVKKYVQLVEEITRYV